MSEFDFQILHLTDQFYDAYPNPPFSEILQKQQRAYHCLLFQSHYDYFICIPFRSEISHPYAYHFKHSKRSKYHKSGLDYTKIVIISNTEYLDTQDAIIDKDEFKRRYSFSSLKYFHKELHINETSHSSTSKCSPLAQGLPTSHLP